jgi:hypothetical protein
MLGCLACTKDTPLHRARFSTDAARLLGGYCSAECARADGLRQLADAQPQGNATWVSLDLDGARSSPWQAAPSTLQDRFIAGYGVGDAAADLLALIAERPERLAHPCTLLEAGQLLASESRGERIALSSMLVDAFSRTGGALPERCVDTVAKIVAALPVAGTIVDADRDAARGWLSEQRVHLSLRNDEADIELLVRVSDDANAWPLPSGAFAITSEPQGRAVACGAASAEAIDLLLAQLPRHARLFRYATDVIGAIPMTVADARAWLQPDHVGALPAMHAPEVLRRISSVLQHPDLRGRAPSVSGALAMLSGTTAADTIEDMCATHRLARLLAEPYQPPFARRYARLPGITNARGPIAACVGLDANGALTKDSRALVTPVAWAIASGRASYVLVADTHVYAHAEESIASAIGMVTSADGAWLAQPPLRCREAPAIPSSARLDPLAADDTCWLGRDQDGTLHEVPGPAPVGPVLLYEGAATVALGLPRTVELALQLALGHDTREAVNITIDADPQETSVGWGPLGLQLSGNELVVSPLACEPPRRVRLLIDDLPIERGVDYSVLAIDDDRVYLGVAQDAVVGTRELPLSELERRFHGSLYPGGVARLRD